MWPVQLTAGLFGVSFLGAQIPMSTFAGSDPGENGYVLALLVGALLFPLATVGQEPREP